MNGNYYGIDLKEQREKLLESNVAKPIIEEFIEIADSCIDKEYKVLKFTDYMLYDLYEPTGDRFSYEEPHRQRRVECTALAAALWLTKDEKYKKPLIDLIFAICDEFTWCVAAHNKMYQANKSDISLLVEEIDLYNARTATCLCDCLAITSDMLPEIVTQRVGYEIRRRITEPLKKHKFRWEELDNNWLVTCVLGILSGLLNFGTEEETKAQLQRINNLLDKYIKGFGEDYCCLEGSGYWSAFREFLRCAVMIEKFTAGEIKYFNREDVKQVALFPQRVLLSEKITTGFSDTGTEVSFSPGCYSFLKKLYKEDFYLSDLSLAGTVKNTMGVGLINLFWFDVNYKKDELKCETNYFKKSEWFVSRRKNYSFAAKGGYNDEVHNHNDIGSFMITKGDKIILEDLGAGLYTKQAFTLETRYLGLNWASWGHSLPIVNGEFQCVGQDYRAKSTNAGENFFETDIAGAYPEGIIRKINRRFELEQDSVTLCDTYEFSEETKCVTERFVTKTKPVISDTCVLIGTSKLIYDTAKFTVTLKEDSYRNHHNTADIAVYFIDFEAKKPLEKEFKLKVEII